MKYIPNILTMFRIFLVPFFIYFFVEDKLTVAFIIFIIASITDYFDGYLARKYQVISNFGKIMDPLADKLLVLSAIGLVTFGKAGFLSQGIFIIITVREVLITILRDLYKKKNIILAANNWGKVKTVMQMVGLTAVFLIMAIGWSIPNFVLITNIYFWVVVVVTIMSGLTYLTRIKELF